jgi:serine/threonine protein kinase
LRREVESLLAAKEKRKDFLGEPAFEIEARAIADERPDLQAGSQISRYRILSFIGAGGMGEVYEALDTTLDRRVALKMLPARFTEDAERLSRFVREAKSASALNHPNIITIYEIGREGDRRFITTEFIEGVTLRRRIAEGSFGLPQALEIADQIAKALDAAHRAGITHRDIKPENIMVRPDGVVKVLDFGLAKLTEPEPGGEDRTVSTITRRGTVMGTPRYMSPEQARGERVDARTDIFSLGIVLYEMIAGRHPFTAKTEADWLVAILDREPLSISSHQPEIPAEVERIVERALAKDCGDRYQTVRELQTDLQLLKLQLDLPAQLARAGRQKWRVVSSSNSAEGKPPFSRRWWLIAGGLLIALVVAGGVWMYVNRLREQELLALRSDLRISQLVNEPINAGGGIQRVSFSPDGKLIAYSFSGDDGSSIRIKQVVGGESSKVTDGKWQDRSPVWSPDGQLLAFTSDRGGTPGVWSVPYLGGTPALLKEMDIGDVVLTSWSKTGRTIYYESRHNLYALDLASGQVTQLTDFDPRGSGANGFSVSPDEKTVAYSDWVDRKAHILVKPMRGGEPTQITHGEWNDRTPSWFPDGKRIAFGSDRAGSGLIYLGWLDGREPFQITVGDDNYDFLTVSPDGSRIVSISQRENANILSRNIRTGEEVERTSGFGSQLFASVSTGGGKIAFQSASTNYRINDSTTIKSLATDDQILQLTLPGFDAKWSPSEDTLAFIRLSSSQGELWRASASGRNEKRLATGVYFGGETLAPYNRLVTNYNWSPDGAKIAYCSKKSGQSNLWVVSSDGAVDTMVSGNTDPNLRLSSPFWSPDGGRIAYVSEKMPFSLNGKRSVRVTEQGKTGTVFEEDTQLWLLGWSAADREIYVALSERKMPAYPQKIRLIRVPSGGGKTEMITHVPDVYLHSIRLSRSGQNIALVSRQNGKDNIKVVSINGGTVRDVTANTDPKVYYSGLAWSPDEKTLFYSRQTSWVLVSKIENLR